MSNMIERPIPFARKVALVALVVMIVSFGVGVWFHRYVAIAIIAIAAFVAIVVVTRYDKD